MKNKYDFSDFTIDNYKRLIDIAKENFKFISFNDLISNKDKKFILWRHDIDASVHRAVKLAEIEAERKVKATYFVHLHSTMYNAFEPEIVDCIKKILNLGHNLGLHFDQEFYGELINKHFEFFLKFEASLLEMLFGVQISVFTFHNTTPFAVSCIKRKYAGLINATSTYFREQVTYCSDSNGYWRFKRLEDVLLDPKIKRLQVLTHPEWWQDEVMSPRRRILRCVEGRATRIIEQYDRALNMFGRVNFD